MFRLFVALCIFGGTPFAATELNNELCEKVEGIKNFNATQFSGFWYRVQDDEELPARGNQYCPIIDIVVDENDVLRMKIALSGIDVYIPDKLNPSNFRFNDSDVDMKMSILATDYQSYAVLHECFIKSNLTLPTIILMRSHNLTLDLNKTINDVLTKNNLEQMNLSPKALKLCEGIQMVGRGKDELRGPTVYQDQDESRCKTVKRVEDFNLSRFLGSWYEMQENFRSCNSGKPSNFSLANNGTGVHILSRGNDDKYYEQNRTYPASFTRYEQLFEDGIFLNIYTVLETDYDSYAIVYDCRVPLEPSYLTTFARKNELTDDFRNKIDHALAENDFGITYLFPKSPLKCLED